MKSLNKNFKRLSNLMTREGLSWLIRFTIESLVSFAYRLHDKSTNLSKPNMSLSDFNSFLQRSGIREGSTVLLHSSWDQMNSSHFSPNEFIENLQKLLGDQGTLVLPAFVSGNRINEGVEFNPDKDHSIAGLLPELFRRMPGVIRSANISHSVAARGKNASFLLDYHHLGNSAWDEFSPYLRIGALEESWIVGVGVGHGLRIVTSLHCVESLLLEHPYFKKLFKKEVGYTFVSSRLGSGSGRVKIPSSVIMPEKLKKYFKGMLIEDTLGGVEVYAIRARDLIEKALDLGLSGKTMYVWPIPWIWLFWKPQRLDMQKIITKISP